MLLVFEIVFSVSVISRIEYIGDGVDGGSGCGAVGRFKHPFGLKE